MDRVVDALERYHAVLDPASAEWPVFPTRHHPSIAAAVRDGLTARGREPADIEAALGESTGMELLR